MTECPVCETTFSGTDEETSIDEAASHLVAESRSDARHRRWVTANTDRGSVSEVKDELSD